MRPIIALRSLTEHVPFYELAFETGEPGVQPREDQRVCFLNEQAALAIYLMPAGTCRAWPTYSRVRRSLKLFADRLLLDGKLL